MDNVNNPSHYNSAGAKCLDCGRPIECIDVIENLVCNRANAVKYIWRMDHKGKPVEDLKKAIWYLEREVRRLQRMTNAKIKGR